MEIWDAYLFNGTLAGCDLVRGEPIPNGLYHLVSEILVRHADGEYLLMQRDPRNLHFGEVEIVFLLYLFENGAIIQIVDEQNLEA